MSKIKYHYTPPKNAPVTNQTLVDDLLSVCESLGARKLSQKVYEENENLAMKEKMKGIQYLILKSIAVNQSLYI